VPPFVHQSTRTKSPLYFSDSDGIVEVVESDLILALLRKAYSYPRVIALFTVESEHFVFAALPKFQLVLADVETEADCQVHKLVPVLLAAIDEPEPFGVVHEFFQLLFGSDVGFLDQQSVRTQPFFLVVVGCLLINYLKLFLSFSLRFFSDLLLSFGSERLL
jgi:hypothetical protein